jgi:flagellum-specific ATP synthase
MDDPVADTVRGIVDGHVILSRRLASFGHYPSIDVLGSVSRTMPSTATPEHVQAARDVRAMAAMYRENEELVRLGAYKTGSDPSVDAAIHAWPHIRAFLQQEVEDATPWEETLTRLAQLASMRSGPQPVPGVRRAPQAPQRRGRG